MVRTLFHRLFSRPSTLILIAISLMSYPANAVHWSVEGPGETSLIVKGNKVFFTYNLDVRNNYGVFEWDLIGHDFAAGNHMFDWDYNGSHDRQQAASILRAEDQQLLDARSGRDGFLYEGRGLTLKNKRPTDFHFRMFATNDDTNTHLTGTLELQMAAVPVPPVFLPFLVMLGLTGFHVTRRRLLLRDNAQG